LQAHSLDEQPDDLAELNRPASNWSEQAGERFQAIEHALAAEDFERAADLVKLSFPAMRRDRRTPPCVAGLRRFRKN
jgi:LuxR family transcriptional regulator, maltose regulon positive regulatory protein